MSNSAQKSLLPIGLRDGLPPYADQEAHLVETLLGAFRGYGYQRVDPPLLEFEENLLDGVGAATSQSTFRLMDPVSQRMMGIRADITPQVERIAATRLKKTPRPLRLSYNGSVLRIKGSQLRPERQFRQVGCELIGSDSALADAEMVILAVDALTKAGVRNLSVDLNLPTVVQSVCRDYSVDYAEARAALDRKDLNAVSEIAGQGARVLEDLLRSTGRVDQALDTLSGIALPDDAAAERDRLVEVVGLVREALPDLSLTVDPVEHRGFEYQTGLSFTIFGAGIRGELGRGGRYRSVFSDDTATGFTLYLDTVLRGLPEPQDVNSVLVAADVSSAIRRELRAAGWVVVASLNAGGDAEREARDLRCSHIYKDGVAVRLEQAYEGKGEAS
ncbi:MAG: ATP phosphoribosyltransferase regulatory subunit [Alphaproteobacteria bacterium]